VSNRFCATSLVREWPAAYIEPTNVANSASSTSDSSEKLSAVAYNSNSEISSVDLRQRYGIEELFLILKSSGCANLTSRGNIEPLRPVLDYGEIGWPDESSVSTKLTHIDVFAGMRNALNIDLFHWMNKETIRDALSSPVSSPKDDLVALHFELSHGHPFGLDDLLIQTARGLIEIVRRHLDTVPSLAHLKLSERA
jgi:hypothetical protein